MIEFQQPAPLRLDLTGSLTIYEVAEAREALRAAFAGARDGDWQLDLGAVDELDSAGAQLLLAAQRHVREAGGALQLNRAGDRVRELLALLRLNELLPGGDAHVQ
ncbi:STAS domain-containing protein [Pseudomonas subflava]|uniref:STAS domain-containing protein n=1 Tax=Pseudomonas subflava TaxID=2952933 RepID=UPI00207ACC29|nr:STAS domain-containing protein [Pseudomonas subflava]